MEEEDCEEGEIREPGQKIYMKPTCRFFLRGHCTWGVNCRFLHPGVNDKGGYDHLLIYLLRDISGNISCLNTKK